MRAGHADVAMLLISAERDAVDEMQLRLERLEAEAYGNSREAARLVALLEQRNAEVTTTHPTPDEIAPPPPPTAGVTTQSDDPRIISESSPTAHGGDFAYERSGREAGHRGPRRTVTIQIATDAIRNGARRGSTRGRSSYRDGMWQRTGGEDGHERGSDQHDAFTISLGPTSSHTTRRRGSSTGSLPSRRDTRRCDDAASSHGTSRTFCRRSVSRTN